MAGGLRTFFDVGRALLTIRESKLYRESYRTFEEYCRKRWDVSRFYAYRLIGAAEVMGNLLPIGNIPLPTSEAQVRPLLSMTPESVSGIWRKVVGRAKDGHVTAKLVKAVIAEITGPPDRKPSPSGSAHPVHGQRFAILSTLLQEVQEAQRCAKNRDRQRELELLEHMRRSIEEVLGEVRAFKPSLFQTGLLTESEERVGLLVREGLSDKEIANRLNVKTSTVQTHVCHVREKLHAHNRVQLALLLWRRGRRRDRGGCF